MSSQANQRFNHSDRSQRTQPVVAARGTLGLNRLLPNGNVLIHCFGTDAAGVAIVTVVAAATTQRLWLNIRSKRKGTVPFSRPVDELFRPAGMTVSQLAYTASRTGYVIPRVAV